MADVNQVRTALAAQVTRYTGLTCLPDMPNQVTVPMAAILPKPPWKYGVTLDGGQPRLAAQDLAFHVLVVISSAADIGEVQAQLDGYLGIGAAVPSIPDALTADPTLSGTVSFCQATGIDSYGPVEIAGQSYFSARVAVIVGA